MLNAGDTKLCRRERDGFGKLEGSLLSARDTYVDAVKDVIAQPNDADLIKKVPTTKFVLLKDYIRQNDVDALYEHIKEQRIHDPVGRGFELFWKKLALSIAWFFG